MWFNSTGKMLEQESAFCKWSISATELTKTTADQTKLQSDNTVTCTEINNYRKREWVNRFKHAIPKIWWEKSKQKTFFYVL